MSKQIKLILATLGFCIGFFVPMVAASPEPVSSSSVIAAETAAARKIVGREFVSDQRTVGSRRGRASVYLSGSTSTVLFDRETGLAVEVYNNAKTFGASGPPHFTSDQALARAIEFLKTTGVNLNGIWTFDQCEYFEGSRVYHLGWRKIFYGIELASFISVTINADDGMVLSYLLVDDPVTIPLQVNLTGEQALDRVVEKKGWLHPVVKTADLQVWYSNGYPGPQALTWRFEIANPDATRGSESYVRAEVNATTGEIVSLDGPAGFFKSLPKGEKMVSVVLPKPNVKSLRHAKLPPTVFQLAAQRKKAK